MVGVGVAGWNTSAAWFRAYKSRLGTLLGPEETPVGVFLVPLLAGWSNALRCPVCGVLPCLWGVGVVAAVVLGCGCVLSVA